MPYRRRQKKFPYKIVANLQQKRNRSVTRMHQLRRNLATNGNVIALHYYYNSLRNRCEILTKLMHSRNRSVTFLLETCIKFVTILYGIFFAFNGHSIN